LDKLTKDFDNSIEAFMGSKVHKALEELYKQQKLGTVLTLEKLLSYFKNQWKKDFTEEIKVVKKETKAKNYYNLAIKYLTDYYKHYYPFNQDYTIGLEMPVNLDLDSNKSIVGYIDRLSIKDNIYYIHDYKTSGTLPTESEIKNNKQLSIYALAIKEMYNNVKDVKLVWHFLAFDTEIVLTNTNFDYDGLKKELIDKINYIESLSLDKFKPKESVLCEWCAYASNCPVKKHDIKTKQLSIAEFKKDYGVNLVNKYYELLEQKAELNTKISELERKIYDFADREKLLNISGSLGSLRLAKFNTVSLPTKGTPKYEALKKILKENNLEQLLSIDSYLLGKYLNQDLLDKNLFDKISALVEKKQIKKIYTKKKREL